MSKGTHQQIVNKIKPRTESVGAKAPGIRKRPAINSVGRIVRLASPRSTVGRCPPWDRNVLFVLLLVVLFASGCERLETVENAYASFGDALRAGAVGEGKWIPELVPPSATDIREAHNLDTNEIWVTFHFSSAELSLITRQCTRATAEIVSRPRRRPGRWWPETLLPNPTAKTSGNAYVHYECGGKTFLSIDPANERAYYWALS
jgi:hypothetical protein